MKNKVLKAFIRSVCMLIAVAAFFGPVIAETGKPLYILWMMVGYALIDFGLQCASEVIFGGRRDVDGRLYLAPVDGQWEVALNFDDIPEKLIEKEYVVVHVIERGEDFG